MKEISSSENPGLKKLAALSRKKERDRQERYVIEGPNLLHEALKNGAEPELVFFRKSRVERDRTEEYDELFSLLDRRRDKTEVMSVSDGIFDRAAQTDTPQGVMAVVKKRRWREEELFLNNSADEAGGGNILVLDRLQDPGNLGTMLRTADGAGFSGVILMKGCGDIYAPKVARACAGTLFRLPVLFLAEPEKAVEMLHHYKKTVCATSPQNSKVYYDCDLRRNTALVIGNEGNGVCEEFLRRADGLLTIPMAGNLESLNAAVAAGILMYETVRQRNGG